MVTATFFYNTGFNAINIPDSPDTLEKAASSKKDMPVMDIIQLYNINNIKVKASESDLINLDYIKLSSGDNIAYYKYADTYTMTSGDVAELSIYMDGLLTAGGLTALNPLSGRIVRISSGDELLTAKEIERYSISDGLLKPSYTPRKNVYSMFGSNAMMGGASVTYRDSNNQSFNWFADKSKQYKFYGSPYKNTIDSSALKDASDPIKITKNSEDTEYTFSTNWQNNAYNLGSAATASTQYQWFGATGGPGVTAIWPGITYYIDGASVNDAFDGKKMLETARVLYAYGVADAITDTYTIPGPYVDIDYSYTNASGYELWVRGKYVYATIDKTISEIISTKLKSYNTLITKLIENSGVTIKLHAIGTGQTAEASPSDLAKYNDADFDDHVRVYCITDPSPSGAPYYRLDTEQNVTSATDRAAELIGAVRGATWQKVPLTFSNFSAASSANALAVRQAYAQKSLQIDSEWSDRMFEHQLAQQWTRNITSTISMGVNAAASILPGMQLGERTYTDNFGNTQANWSAGNGMSSGQATGILGRLTENAIAEENVKLNYANQQVGFLQRELAQSQELSAYAASHPAKTINTSFAVTDGSLMMTGNGAMIELNMPAEEDVTKYITIIQMYGIPLDLPLAPYADDTHKALGTINKYTKLDANKHYCYIQTAGLSLGPAGSGKPVPVTVLANAADMLNGGVRIWNKKPNISEYKTRYKNK